MCPAYLQQAEGLISDESDVSSTGGGEEERKNKKKNLSTLLPLSRKISRKQNVLGLLPVVLRYLHLVLCRESV